MANVGGKLPGKLDSEMLFHFINGLADSRAGRVEYPTAFSAAPPCEILPFNPNQLGEWIYPGPMRHIGLASGHEKSIPVGMNRDMARSGHKGP
jgi:hypothetical protein